MRFSLPGCGRRDKLAALSDLRRLFWYGYILPFKNNDFVFDFGAGDADIVVFDGISGESFDSDFLGMKISQRGINLRQR